MSNQVAEWAGPALNVAKFINTLANGWGDVYGNPINCDKGTGFGWILVLYNATAQPSNFDPNQFSTPPIPKYGTGQP